MQEGLDQEKILIPKDEVMDDFCFSFSFYLLKKIKELKREKMFFNERGFPTTIAYIVKDKLNKQLGYNLICGGDDNTESSLEKSIKIAEEFLSIFAANPKV